MEYRAFRLCVETAAKNAGLTDYELYYEKSRSQTLSAFRGEIDGFNLGESVGVCFRCIVDGRAGYASTERMEEDEAETLVRSAMDSAKYVESNEPELLYGEPETLNSVQPAREADVNTQIQAVLALEKAALDADERIHTVATTRLMSGVSEKGILNSCGVDKVCSQQYYGWYTSPVAGSAEKPVNGFGVQITREFEQLDAEKVVAEATENTLSQLGAKRIPSGKYKIVLSNDVTGDFLSTFDSIFSSEAVQKGMSLLGGREGEQIAADCVTLVDDPMCPDAVFQLPFDDEGVAAQRTVLIENGRLNTLLYNLKTAAKAGCKTTGNAYKPGLSARVTVAPTNLCLQPGQRAQAELFEMAGEGLYVTEISGMHAGANETSGDFSLVAKGFLIRDGKRAEPVELITIAGNFYQMLKDVLAVGNDLRFGFPNGAGQIGAPSVYIRELNVSGE